MVASQLQNSSIFRNLRINMAVIDDFRYFSYYCSSVFVWNHVLNRIEEFKSLSKPSIRHKNVQQKLLSVCCRHLGNTLYLTGPISDSRNLLRKHVRHAGNHSGTQLKVCYCHGGATAEIDWVSLK